MPEQGLSYIGSYSAGPGISDPGKVFGAADVAILTNNRIDNYVQEANKEKAKQKALSQEMLKGLSLDTKGILPNHLEYYTKAKQEM